MFVSTARACDEKNCVLNDGAFVHSGSVCRYYAASGHCYYGDSCNYVHTAAVLDPNTVTVSGGGGGGVSLGSQSTPVLGSSGGVPEERSEKEGGGRERERESEVVQRARVEKGKRGKRQKRDRQRDIEGKERGRSGAEGG